jgi:hypothetical protein
MPEVLAEIERQVALLSRGLLTPTELVGFFFYRLPRSPETSVAAACSLLSPALHSVLRSRIAEIRSDDYVYIPFLIGDDRTPEEKCREAVSLIPAVKRVCESADEWFQTNGTV